VLKQGQVEDCWLLTSTQSQFSCVKIAGGIADVQNQTDNMHYNRDIGSVSDKMQTLQKSAR